MRPDTVTLLVLLLSSIAASAIPIVAWLRAQKRIRQLEMTLMAQDIESAKNEDLRDLMQRLVEQTEQLADVQALLSHRLNHRGEPLPLSPAAADRVVTPH